MQNIRLTSRLGHHAGLVCARLMQYILEPYDPQLNTLNKHFTAAMWCICRASRPGLPFIIASDERTRPTPVTKCVCTPPTINYASVFKNCAEDDFFDDESWLSCLHDDAINMILTHLDIHQQDDVFLAFPRVAERIGEEDKCMHESAKVLPQESVVGMRGFTPLMTRFSFGDDISEHIWMIAARGGTIG